MSRRVVLVLLLLPAVAWLAASVSLVVFEHVRPVTDLLERATIEDTGEDVAEKWNVPTDQGWFRRGYADMIGAEFGEGDSAYHCIWRRGRVIRRTATFPFRVRYAAKGMGELVSVRLEVHDRTLADADDAGWTRVAEVEPVLRNERYVALIDEVEVPASSRYFRVEHVEANGDTWWNGHSMPRAETWLGRVYDRCAWWPIFRWLPD